MAKIEIIVWKSDDAHCPPGLKFRAQCLLNGEKMPVVFSGTDGEALRETARASVQADLDAAEQKRANYAAGAAKRKAAKAGGVDPSLDTPAETPAPATADDDLIL